MNIPKPSLDSLQAFSDLWGEKYLPWVVEFTNETEREAAYHKLVSDFGEEIVKSNRIYFWEYNGYLCAVVDQTLAPELGY